MFIHRISIVLIALVGLCTVGCAKSGQKYVAPELPDSEVAIVKGSWGTYIEKVNGAAVGSAFFKSENFGSNSVRVTPGVQYLTITMNYGNPRWSDKDTYQFAFRFDKGHKYEFSPAGVFDLRLKVVDQTTKQTMYIE